MDRAGSVQDGTILTGRAWHEPRFSSGMAGVIDCLTGLCRHQGANVANGEVSREQALASIETLNTTGSQAGRRLPNINELVSLVDCSHAPPAPARAMYRHHLPDAVYRSLTSSRYEPDRAWVLPVDGGAMGVGHRQQARLVVRAVREARLTAMDLHDLQHALSHVPAAV